MNTNAESSRWFYEQDGDAIGPFTFSSIEILVNAGHLQREALIMREGHKDWQPLSDILPQTVRVFSTANLLRARQAIFHARIWINTQYEKNAKVTIGLVLVILFASIFRILPNVFSHSNETSTVFVEGLTSDVSKLRLIKAGSNLFADEKTKLEREKFEAEKRPVMRDRLSYEGRYITITTTRAAELLEEDTAKGLSRVRVHNRALKKNLELWTQTSNVIPFDNQLAKQGDEEYEAKFRERNAKQAQREQWLGKVAKIKGGALLFVNDDALWQWLESTEQAESKNDMSQARAKAVAAELVAAKHMIITGGHGSDSGSVVNVRGPFLRWLQIETHVNGSPARFWAFDDDVTIE